MSDETNRAFYAAVKQAATSSLYEIYIRAKKDKSFLLNAFKQLASWSDVVASDELGIARSAVPDADSKFRRLAMSYVRRVTKSDLPGKTSKVRTTADLSTFDKFYGEFMKALATCPEVMHGSIFSARPIDRDIVIRDAFLAALDRVVKVVKVEQASPDMDLGSIVSTSGRRILPSVVRSSSARSASSTTFDKADMSAEVGPDDSISTVMGATDGTRHFKRADDSESIVLFDDDSKDLPVVDDDE